MLTKYYKINPFGDGNCGLRAISFGVVELILRGALDDNGNAGKYNLFVEKCHLVLGIENSWSAVKNFCVSHKDQPKKIEDDLGSILRLLVAELTNDAPPLDTLIQALQAAFDEHVLKSFLLPIGEKFLGDDIFTRHSFIVDTFKNSSQIITKEVYEQAGYYDKLTQAYKAKSTHSVSEEQQTYLDQFEALIAEQKKLIVDWFEREGYRKFLTQMESQYAWAGDMEFKHLGAYFDIDISSWNRADYQFSIYRNRGSIPSEEFSSEEISVLVQRGIVEDNPETKQLNLLEMTEEVLNSKLGGIPSCEFVAGDWCEKADPQKDPSKIIVSEQITRGPDLQSLIERGVIKQDTGSGKYYYFSDLDMEKLFEKLGPLACAEKFKQLWTQSYLPNRLSIMLSNPHAAHWYYLQPKESPWHELQQLEDKEVLVLDEGNKSPLFEDRIDFFSLRPMAPEHLFPSFQASSPKKSSILSSDRGNQMVDGMHEVDFLFRNDGEIKIIPASSISSSYPVFDPLGMQQEETNLGLIDDRDPLANFSFLESDESESDNEEKEDPDDSIFTERRLYESEIEKYFSNSFFARRSPTANTPTGSPPNSFTGRPFKKQKPSQNQQLKEMAGDAWNELIKLNSGISNPLVKRLIEAYDVIHTHTTGEIGGTDDAFLLLDPIQYAAIKKIDVPEAGLPSKVKEFSDKFLCEIILKAQKAFCDKFRSLYVWLSLSLNKGFKNEATQFFEQLNQKATAVHFSIEQLREMTHKFDLVADPDLLSNTGEINNLCGTLSDMKEYLDYCEMVLSKLSPQACAESILKLIEGGGSSRELSVYLNIFKEIARYGLNDLTIEMQELLNFQRESLDNIAVGKAIEAFVQLFREKLARPLYDYVLDGHVLVL